VDKRRLFGSVGVVSSKKDIGSMLDIGLWGITWFWAIAALSIIQILVAAMCGVLFGRSMTRRRRTSQLDPATAEALIGQLQQVNIQVAEDVIKHQSEMSQQNDSLKTLLTSSDASLAGVVLGIVRQIIHSNTTLQKQLAAAEVALDRQQDQIRSHMTTARTDELTEMPNRRAFNEELARIMAQIERNGAPLSVILLDLDHFKQINDRYGHLSGDRVLREVSATICGAIRDMDIPARYGGEEFAVILPDTKAHDAAVVAERTRTAIGEMMVEFDGHRLSVTASQGVAEATLEDNADSLVANADEALYAAKKDGRNCVRLYHDVSGTDRARGAETDHLPTESDENQWQAVTNELRAAVEELSASGTPGERAATTEKV